MYKKLIGASLCIFLSACANMEDSVHNYKQTQELSLLKQYGVFKSPQQTILYDQSISNKSWKVIDTSLSDMGLVYTLVPENENSSNWTESLTLSAMPYEKNKTLNAESLIQNDATYARQICKKVQSNIEFKSSEYTIYTLDVTGCGDNEGRSKIGKIFVGNDALYEIAYFVIPEKVSNAEIISTTNMIKLSKLSPSSRFGETSSS